jgi:hypothetical protein
MKKGPIRVEEEHPVEKPCPARGKRGCPRFSFDAPLEYSTRDGSAVRGAYAGNASETGLLIYSIDQLQVGADLRLLVFYPNGYQLDNFQAVARIIWKEYHYEKEWKGFKYGLEFVYMSDTDRRKLREILKKTLIQQSDLWKQGADPGLQAMEATP